MYDKVFLELLDFFKIINNYLFFSYLDASKGIQTKMKNILSWEGVAYLLGTSILFMVDLYGPNRVEDLLSGHSEKLLVHGVKTDDIGSIIDQTFCSR